MGILKLPVARIEIRGLRKAFGSHVVLDHVDLTLNAGETLVVMGESGSGKSVLAKCVLGLLSPDGGKILLDGMDVTHLRSRERQIMLEKFGVLFQRGALFDSLPAWQNVAFGLIEGRGMAIAQAEVIALGKLAQVGLDRDAAMLTPAELSGGMQKRVALARAIALSPEFLILDEPTEGLDPILSAIIDNLVVKTTSELKSTTLAITNNIPCARRIATRIALLLDGRITWCGAAADIDASGNAYVERFMRGQRMPNGGIPPR